MISPGRGAPGATRRRLLLQAAGKPSPGMVRTFSKICYTFIN